MGGVGKRGEGLFLACPRTEIPVIKMFYDLILVHALHSALLMKHLSPRARLRMNASPCSRFCAKRSQSLHRNGAFLSLYVLWWSWQVFIGIPLCFKVVRVLVDMFCIK